jgi:hypothetical protein
MNFVKPALVGAYSAGGLYVARYLKGSSDDISTNALATAAAVGFASAWVAPSLSKNLVCEKTPGSGLVEASASAAVSWAAVLAMSDMESANMFVPVQLGSHIVANFTTPYVLAWFSKKDDKKKSA